MRDGLVAHVAFRMLCLVLALSPACFDGSSFRPPAPGLLAPLTQSDVGFQAAGLSAAQWEAYWYSRYDLGSVVMKSGNGETFMPSPALMAGMVAMVSDDLSAATPPTNPALLKRIYDSNDPAFVNANNGNPNDFINGRWGPAPATSTTSYEAAAWTMIKELQWARLFHVDGHFGFPETPNSDGIPGAQQRFAGLVLFAEALMQRNEFAGNPAKFVSSTAGQYVMLWALSDLKSILSAQVLPHSKANRCRQVAAMMMAPQTADQIADAVLAQADALYAGLPTPVSVRERSVAIQALAWYAWACPTNAVAAHTRIVIVADALVAMAPATPAERAYAIRGLVEGFRLTENSAYLTAAAAHFVALVDDYHAPSGSFSSQTTYTSDDVAVILGALNALRLFAGTAVDQALLAALVTNFFEGAINQSGMQIAAPPTGSLPAYERALLNNQDVLFRYPESPVPPAAGGANGIAPVHAASVTLLNGQWTWEQRYNTAGGMHLSNEMLWFHDAETAGFPSRIADPLVTDPEYRDAGIAAVAWEGYWYSRYDLGHLVMRSGNGDTFMPNSAIVGLMVNAVSDDLSTATPNPTAALIDRAYDTGDPSFLNPSNGDPNDFTNFRWLSVGGTPASVSSQEALGWTMLKEIQWARQFHVDSHFGEPKTPNVDGIPGAQQRFGGGILFVEAFLQYKKFRSSPALFTQDLAGRYVLLASISDLGALLSVVQLDQSSGNRYRTIVEAMTGLSADAVATDILAFADALYLGLLGDPAQPATLRELALAVQSLTWYAEATKSFTAGARARLLALAEELASRTYTDASERGFALRALMDAHRISGDEAYRDRASSVFREMVVDYSGFHGVFRSKNTYTVDDLAAILGGLNALRLFAGDKVNQSLVLKMTSTFFESAMNRSGMQIAAPPLMLIPQYEQDKLGGRAVFFRYPSLPVPGAVPGSGGNGTAPVFASQVTFNPATATWSAQQTSYDTAGSMRLSNELIWYHNAEVNGFPGGPPAPSVPLPTPGGGGGGGGGPPPTVTVTFTADIEPILAGNCVCHRNGNVSGGFDQSTYESVLAGGNNNATSPEVVPGNGAGSLMFQKVSMDSPPVGSRMPLGGPFLSFALQQKIKDWIDQGANR